MAADFTYRLAPATTWQSQQHSVVKVMNEQFPPFDFSMVLVFLFHQRHCLREMNKESKKPRAWNVPFVMVSLKIQPVATCSNLTVRLPKLAPFHEELNATQDFSVGCL